MDNKQNTRWMNWTVTTLAMMVVFSGFAQPAKDLLALNQAMQNAKSISSKVTVELLQGDKVLADYNGAVYWDGKSQYSDLMGVKNIRNQNEILAVLEEQSRIIYQPNVPTPAQAKPTETDLQALTESLTNQENFQLKYLGHNNAAERKIELVAKQKQEIVKMHLVVRLADHSLREITYFYTPNRRSEYNTVRIKYPDFAYNQSVSKQWFSTKPYVQKQKGAYTPTSKYAAYELQIIEP